MPAKVLLAIPNVPYPLVSGGHLRDWQILNLLNRIGIKPAVLYFGAGENYHLESGSPVESLASSLVFGGGRVECPDRNLWHKLGRKLGYLYGRDGGSFPFSYQYDAMGAGRIILESAEIFGAEAVVLRAFFCHHAPALKERGLKVIANCPDYNTRLAIEMVKCVKNPFMKIGPFSNYIGVRRQERTCLPLCDEVWVPTEDEVGELAGIISPERLLKLPNLLDVESYPDYSEESGEEAVLLFVANYGYAPNANAARLLLTSIFPEVRKVVPSAKLILVGGGLPGDLLDMARAASGVEVAGFVGNLRPYYKRAEVVLLPVLEGAGMLFKALEALAFGKAVVGFHKSFRGLGGDGSRPYISVGSCEEMAPEIIRLLKDKNSRVSLSKRARVFVREEFSWEQGETVLEQSLLWGLRR